MTEDHDRRTDNGRILGKAMAAVMLIVAGLGLMVWDDRRNVRDVYSLSPSIHNSERCAPKQAMKKEPRRSFATGFSAMRPLYPAWRPDG
jgi:hypothetical protein